jgi:hypothetical protein
MADLTGLAGGIAQGFQLGNNFFNTIDQRQRQNVQDERNAELFKMQQDQFAMQTDANNLTNELNQIKVNQTKSQLGAKQEVGELSTLMNDVLMGADPSTVVDRLNALNIDLTPIVDATLKSAIDDLGQGKYDPANPSHTDAINFLMGPKVKQVVGMTGQNGEEIVDVRVVNIVPNPANPEMLVPELEVQTSSGAKYLAPITQNRTANPDDPIIQISMDAAIQKAMGTRQLYQFLDRDDIRTVVQNRINQISAPYTTIQDGFAINTLTGGYEYVKPMKPPQPTKASLAVLAQGTGPEADSAKAALQALDSEKNPTEASLALLAATGDKEAELALKKIAEVNAASTSSEAEILRSTEKYKVQVRALEKNAETAATELAELNEQSDNLQQFEQALLDLQEQGGETGALAGYRMQALAIAKEFGFNINEAELNSMQTIQAINARLVLAGMSAIKGVASESDRAYVEASTAQLTTTVAANKKIIEARRSALMKQKYANRATIEASKNYDNPAVGLAEQKEIQTAISEVPATGILLVRGELRPVSLYSYVESRKMAAGDAFLQANSATQDRLIGEYFAEFKQKARIGLNKFKGIGNEGGL